MFNLGKTTVESRKALLIETGETGSLKKTPDKAYVKKIDLEELKSYVTEHSDDRGETSHFVKEVFQEGCSKKSCRFQAVLIDSTSEVHRLLSTLARRERRA